MVAAPLPAAADYGDARRGRAEPFAPAQIGFRAMGVLDDAIREHLELRRKHGATEEELQRQEMEALGPARREAGAPEEQGLDPEGVESAGEVPGRPEPVAGGTASEELELHPDDAAPKGRPPYHEEGAAEISQEPRLDDSSAEAFTADEGEEVRQGELDQADSDRGGDVLEDTPEFLQETPEHDRLWFEQRPPRDFDFD
jgi:hypothetical protein